ncbi:MAG: PilZ domain-containing protein [Deltaproteobacteria bacterium]|nr:PilZ domain-containing protein [Deltaproteobacteria bacterium]
MGDRAQSDKDRRRDHRFDRRFSVQVAGDSTEGLRAESINISSRGLYCKVPRYVHPFSKLNVALDLPFVGRDAGKMECEGVVVRVEPETELPGVKEYRLAIYFLNLDRAAADAIHAFLAEGH